MCSRRDPPFTIGHDEDIPAVGVQFKAILPDVDDPGATTCLVKLRPTFAQSQDYTRHLPGWPSTEHWGFDIYLKRRSTRGICRVYLARTNSVSSQSEQHCAPTQQQQGDNNDQQLLHEFCRGGTPWPPLPNKTLELKLSQSLPR